MLLTDGNPNKTDDLRVYESAILSLANTEMIDLEVKLGLATEELSQEVLDFILNRSAVGDPRSATRRTMGVSDIAVTRQMRRWHALHTLSIVYRDAFHNQLNDRYRAMFEEYRRLSRQARDQTFQFGVGLVYTPVPQAEPPVFSSVAGADPETLYYGRLAWLSSTGQEGAPSDLTSVSTPSASLPVVGGEDAPAVAASFNVYLGLTPDTVTLQNLAPVPVGQTFTLPVTGLIEGDRPGEGQAPDLYLTGGPILRRG